MKNFLKFTLATILLVCCWSVMAVAQAATPAPQGGFMGWVNAHGGLQAAALLLMFSALTMLSAFRTVLYKFDGLDLNQPIPEGYKGLTLVNKICLLLGNVVDFLTGNTQHK